MAADTAGDEVGEEGVTRFVKGRADTGEHLLADVAKLAFGGLKGQLLHFGLADVARLVPDRCGFWRCFRRYWRSQAGNYWQQRGRHDAG